MTRSLILPLLIAYTVNAGWPITEPGTVNGRSTNEGPTWTWEGGEKVPVPYNMIDAYPSCYERGKCPMFKPGGKISSFPNSEEKVEHLLHNMFRMFGNQSLNTTWGKWLGGFSGNRTYYCDAGCDYCGRTHIDRKPLYWYSDANQAARFKQYDQSVCDPLWYEQPGISLHSTCDRILDEYGGGSHCDLFDGSCGFEARGVAFSPEDDAWFETEGICGANTCYIDAHCDPTFANKYDYHGTGFVENMEMPAAVYSRATDEINYTLHSGAHLDQRMRIAEEDRDSDGKYFTLMAMYFDIEKEDNMDTCWSLYDGAYHEMGVEVSFNIVNGGHNGGIRAGTTFLSDSYNVMVSSYHYPPINTCEPYAFICKSQFGKFFRLPEDPVYYFGTEWLDYSWSDYEGNWDLSCKENHYYDNGTQWIVNGDPKLDKCDIWYYRDQSYSECIGCPKIPKLQCLEDCIYSDFDTATCSACDSITGTSYGNEYCATASPTTLSPTTASPTTAYPTLPSESPTTAEPSLPSEAPTTADPTSPTHEPSTSPIVSIISSTEEGQECPGLDLAITLFYFFEYDRIQRKCEICLSEERSKRAERRCEKIEDFITQNIDDYSNCMLNVCDYGCTVDKLQISPTFVASNQTCGCNVFECGPQTAGDANRNNALLVMILVFVFVTFG